MELLRYNSYWACRITEAGTLYGFYDLQRMPTLPPISKARSTRGMSRVAGSMAHDLRSIFNYE